MYETLFVYDKSAQVHTEGVAFPLIMELKVVVTHELGPDNLTNFFWKINKFS